MMQLLGLPLDIAIEKIRAMGKPEPEIELTWSYKRQHQVGEFRVAQVKGGGAKLVVADFITQALRKENYE